MAEFTPVGELAQQSQGAWDAITDSIRRRSAYNALAKVYGPIAGDPVNALRMQAYGQNEQMNPLQVQGAQLNNAGKAQQNDYLAQSYPQQLIQQQEEAKQAGQKTEANDFTLEGQKALRARGVLSGALSALGGDDDGTPEGRQAKWDSVIQRSAPLLGADPAALDQQLAAQKQEYLAGGKDALGKMQQELDSVTLGALSPLDRAKIAGQQQKTAADAARTDYITAQTDTTKARTGLIDAQTAWTKAGKPKPGAAAPNNTPGSFTDSRVTGVLGTKTDWSDPDNPGLLTTGPQSGAIGRAMAAVDKMPDSVMVRGIGEYVNKYGAGHPVIATLAPQLNAYLTAVDQIGHNLPLDDYRSLKEQGGSLGRVTNVEFMALKGAIASLDAAQSKDQIKSSLVQIAQLYQRMQDREAVARGGKAVMPDFQQYEATQQADQSNIAADQALQQTQQPAAPAPGAEVPPAPAPDPLIMNAPPEAAPELDPTTTQSIPQQPGPAASSPAGSAAVPPAASQQQAAPVPTPAAPPQQRGYPEPPPVAQQAIAAASQRYGVDPGYLAKTAWIESKFKADATSSTGASGPWQFTSGTARRVGLRNTRNWGESAMAAARLTRSNESVLQNGLGRAPTQGELYLAHQQGAAGALKLLRNPNAPAASAVGERAVRVNGGKPGMTAGQFANMWVSRFNSAPGTTGPATQDASAPAGGVQGPAQRNALLPPGSGDLGPAADYQAQTGADPASVAAQGPAPAPGGAPEPPMPAGALGAPPTGPGAATPQAPQVAWEQVLPYLPELLSMLQERRKGSRNA